MKTAVPIPLSHLVRIAAVTCLVLLVPLVAMQLSDQVHWTVFDFTVAACLLIGAGLAYELLASRARSPKRRAVIGLVVFALLVAVWVQLAVGIFD